jgi:type II secretory pathway pseudopilin PulG
MRSRFDPQRGFTYIGLLIAVVIMGLMLTVVSRVWTTTEQRERETQLLFIGHAYRMAIASYFASGHQFPHTLQDLVMDERFPIPEHHLRRLYPDPVTGKADWSLILTLSGQGIMGVASSSRAAPRKRDGFDLIDQLFKGADCYCLWQFVYYANRFNRPVTTGATISSNPDGSAVPSFQPGNVSPLTPGSGSLVAPGSSNAFPGAPSPFQPGHLGTFAPRSASPVAPGSSNPAPSAPSPSADADPN